MNDKAISKLLKLINNRDNFLILMHQNPDGDTIASSIALMIVLKKIGKQATCVSTDEIPAPFKFLPGIDKIKKDFLLGDYEAVFLIDCGDSKRSGFPERIRQYASRKHYLVNIDHHQRNDLHKIANINIFSETAASTGEILIEIFNKLKVEIDQDIATCLLTSLYYDTGGFQHSNTAREVLEEAAWLLSKGGRLDKISKNIVLSKSVPSLKLWGIALERIQTNPKLGIVYSFITEEDIKKVSATSNDLSGVVNLINSIPSFKMAILFSETPEGKIKASMRTENDNLDLARFASYFGGGGLKKAAGFVVSGRLTKSQDGWRII